MADILVKIVGFILLALVAVSPVACSINRDNQVAKAIERGVEPADAYCAFLSNFADGVASQTCMLRAERQKLQPVSKG